MELSSATRAEDSAFDRAVEIAQRALANVETVVHGKTDEVKLVLAALVCGGHVLLEDVPGRASSARPTSSPAT